MIYCVQPNESIWKVAEKFGVSPKAIQIANPQIINPEHLLVGEMLYIPINIDWHAFYPKGVQLPEVSDPWPEVRVQGPNPEYARLLMEDYAGNVSETTAIMLYLYHHQDMEEDLPEVSELLEGIAIIEMHHQEILADLIKMLGGNPIYSGKDGQLWTAEYVSYYSQQPCQQIQADINAEKAAIRQYQKHIKMINDPYIQAILQRIIKDEEYHLKLFTDMYRKYCQRFNRK